MSRTISKITVFLTALLFLQLFSFVLVIDHLPAKGADYTEIDDWMLVGRDEYLKIRGDETAWGFGNSIATGDIDGDGRDDIMVGIPTYTGQNGAGAVLVYFARDLDEFFPFQGTSDADLIIYGVDSGDRFGTTIAAGDMDGDGRDELLISASEADGVGESRRSSGEVYILQGRLRSEYPSRMWIGNVGLYGHIYGRDAADLIGQRMVLGDLTGDGLYDLALGTNGAGGYGGTSEYEHGYENSALGSWEIEVIQGSSDPINNIILDLDPKMVRYFSSWNSTATVTTDNHAMEIGKGMDIVDFNGDGTGDLVFSFTRWELDVAMSSEISVITGGPDFPHVPLNSTIDVIIPSYAPNMTIELNDTVLVSPILEGGNLDGDPYHDLVIGAPATYDITGTRADAGQVWILRGFDHTDGQIIYSDRINTTIYGEDSSDHLGATLLCSDLDGDSIDEILIGAPKADGARNQFTSCGEGLRYEIDGTFPEILNVTDADIRYMGMKEGQMAFSHILALNVNSDDHSEFLTASPGFTGEDGTTTIGMVSMFMQVQEFETRLFGSDVSSTFGAVTLIADLNSDGYNDMVISDPLAYTTNVGGVYLFFGSATGWKPIYDAEKDADIVYETDLHPSQTNFGSSLASGDLNNDGYPDLVIGAPEQYDGMNNGGAFQIFWGGTRSYMEQENYKRVLGYSVEKVGYAVTVGDFDGNGIDDLAVSSPGTMASQSLNRYHAGNVFIFLGPISSTSGRIGMADVKITGSIANEMIGQTLVSGDVDGDGIDDLVIGAPRSDLGSIPDQGLVYIMKGRSTWNASYDLLSDGSVRIFGPWQYDQIGLSLAIGDLDNDGKAELAIGSPSGDGYQRTTPQGGNAYLLFGEYLASIIDGGDISLRTDWNLSIFGEMRLERLGSSLAIGDLDGDGSKDLGIGAKGFKDQLSGATTGGTLVLYSKLIKDGTMLNSSSLPVLSSKGDGDLSGSSISIGNLSGNEKMDLLMGSPAHDPYGDGRRPGGAFLWEGKDLFYRDVKISTARIISDTLVPDPDGERGELQYLSPMAGPYTIKVSGRSLGGYQDIDSLSIKMKTLMGTGDAMMDFDTDTRTFSLETTGIFQDRIWLDISNCSASNDDVETWYADIAFYIGWNMPDPSMITTEIQGGLGTNTNYLSKEFRVDRTISIEPEGFIASYTQDRTLDDWARNDTEIMVENITLHHTMNGEQITGMALNGVNLGLYRPDGILIGRGIVNGSTLMINATPVGDGITSSAANFRLAPLMDEPLPVGSIWKDNQTITLKVDTGSPPEVSSFAVFADGKEAGIDEIDNDRFVEIYWENIFDIGPSGIDRFILEISRGNAEPEIYDPAERGTLLMLDEGEIELTLWAIDRAGNLGPGVTRNILTDTTPPIFTRSMPPSDTWLTWEVDELSILVIDSGSGIDPSTARYRTFRADSDILTEWSGVLGWQEEENGTRLVAPVPSMEAYNHYIQWSVADMAGITAISEPIPFSIDLTPPSIDAGDTSVTIGPGTYMFECYMYDQLSWLDLSTVEFRFDSHSSFQDSNWYKIGLEGSRVSASPSIEVDPDFQGYGYAQWRVWDRAGNLAEGDQVAVLVDRTMPEFTGFLPNSSLVQSKVDLDVSAFISEEASGMVKGDVEFSVSRLSTWILYGVGGYSPWTQVDELQTIGGSYMATSTVTLDEGAFNLIRFRARDQAGNGWVISTPISIEVALSKTNLPPSALFSILPAVDLIYEGESIILNASASIDPEGEELTFKWYSDLEGYPGDGLIATGMEANATLTTIGVHNIQLIVTDGTHTVSSEKVRIRVIEIKEAIDDDEVKQDSLCTKIKDLIWLLILVLILGSLSGLFAAYLFWGQREVDQRPMDDPMMINAVYDPGQVTPYCPYCSEEAKISDEYCVKCGSVFTEKDKDNMLKGKKKKKRKKEPLKAAPDIEPPDEVLIEDWEIPDEDEIGSDLFTDSPEEIEIEEIEVEGIDEYDLEEVEEIEVDLEDLELEEEDLDEEWEVEE